MTDLTLTCRRTIKAAPEAIFNAWLDPAMMTKFINDCKLIDGRCRWRVLGMFTRVEAGDPLLFVDWLDETNELICGNCLCST